MVWLALAPVIALLTALERPATADPTYRYTDDHGTIVFTDDAGTIPGRYRDRVTVLGAPPTTSDGTEHPDYGSPRVEPTPGRTSDAGTGSRFSIPIPSRFQTAIGLMTALLGLGLGIALRFSRSAAARIVLKCSLLAVIAGATYLLAFTNLNERMSAMAGGDAHPVASGSDVAQGAREVITSFSAAADRTAETTLGAARQAAEAVNQANQEITRATE